MAKRVMSRKIIGGPMHGQLLQPRSKWPAFLKDDGTTMDTKQGDRIFYRRTPFRANAKITSGYALRRTKDGDRAYFHSSTIERLPEIWS